MIRPIQITLNAAHPELPLVEASTFVGSPSTAFVRGVPATVGSWSITAVRLVFAYPDNSIVTANCVNAASGVWVGTIAPTATSGRTANGYQVLADGIDENGDAVTGYVLGMGDLAVYTRDMTIDGAAGVKWYLHYFDTAPATPKKGDVAKVNGLICLYDGTAWVSFGDGPGFSTDAPAMDGTASAGVAETAARSDHRHPTDTTRASTADATLVNASDWVCSPAEVGGVPVYIVQEGLSGAWYPRDGEGSTGAAKGDAQSLSLSWAADEWYGGVALTATRAALGGYVLGSQSDKPLASEAEAEALRDGKLDKNGGTITGNLTTTGEVTMEATADLKFNLPRPRTLHDLLSGKQPELSDTQLANIAAVSDALAFDATHTYAAGDPVVYDGTLYTFTTAHTGAWTGSDVSAVDIIARLAGKLDKSGGTMTGRLTFYDARLILMPDLLVPSMTVMGASIVFPTTDGTLALTAGTGHTGNLAALDASGNPTDAGYHFEVRNGIPCIVQYT